MVGTDAAEGDFWWSSHAWIETLSAHLIMCVVNGMSRVVFWECEKLVRRIMRGCDWLENQQRIMQRIDSINAVVILWLTIFRRWSVLPWVRSWSSGNPINFYQEESIKRRVSASENESNYQINIKNVDSMVKIESQCNKNVKKFTRCFCDNQWQKWTRCYDAKIEKLKTEHKWFPSRESSISHFHCEAAIMKNTQYKYRHQYLVPYQPGQYLTFVQCSRCLQRPARVQTTRGTTSFSTTCATERISPIWPTWKVQQRLLLGIQQSSYKGNQSCAHSTDST